MKNIWYVGLTIFSTTIFSFDHSRNDLWHKRQDQDKKSQQLYAAHQKLLNEFYLSECRSTGNYDVWQKLFYSDWVKNCHELNNRIRNIKKQLDALDAEKNKINNQLNEKTQEYYMLSKEY